MIQDWCKSLIRWALAQFMAWFPPPGPAGPGKHQTKARLRFLFGQHTFLPVAKPIIIHFAREISADVISLWEISRRSSEKSAADRNASALGPGWPSDPRLNPNPMSGWIDWLVLGKKVKPSNNYGVVCSAATHSHLHLQGKAIKVFPYIERGR